MEKCKDTINVGKIYLIDVKDIKRINDNEGIVMKRKYGKFKRTIQVVDYKDLNK